MEQGDVILVVHDSPSSPSSAQQSASVGLHRQALLTVDEGPASDRPLSKEPARFCAHRKTLAESSDYFRSLFSNFKEAEQDTIAVHWDPDVFAQLLAFVHGATLTIEPSTIIPLIQSAYMFGVSSLLDTCRRWVAWATPTPAVKTEPVVGLDLAADLWSAAREVAGTAAAAGRVADLCEVTLAVFFEDAVAQEQFKDAPLELLLAVVNHECLTIRSETVVCQALFEWACDGHADMWATLSKSIRWAVLPLPFLLALRQRTLFPLEVPASAVQLASQPQASASSERRPVLAPECAPRLSRFSHAMDLSRCQQLNEALFFTLFQRPCLSLTCLDISHCWRLMHPAILLLLPTLLPNLTLLCAADCPNLPSNITLLDGHPRLETLDLSVTQQQAHEPLPLPWRSWMTTFRSGESTLKQEQVVECKDDTEIRPLLRSAFPRVLYPRLARLSLRGRGRVDPAFLSSLGTSCRNLSSLDISWCPAVSDSSIAGLVLELDGLEELRAAGTGLGPKTAAALLLMEEQGSQGQEEEGAQTQSDRRHGVAARGLVHLRVLDATHCRELDRESAALLLRGLPMLEELFLSGWGAQGLPVCPASSRLRALNVDGLSLGPSLLAALVESNPQLRHLIVRGCKAAKGSLESRDCDKGQGDAHIKAVQREAGRRNSRKSSEHKPELVPAVLKEENGRLLASKIGLQGAQCRLETLKMGWGFDDISLGLMGPALIGLRSLTLGLGAAVSDAALGRVAEVCPLLEHLRLRLLMISEGGIIPLVQTARHLRTFSLHHCAGPFTSRLVDALAAAGSGASLRTLKLVGGASSLEDHDIAQLTRGLLSLEKLALSGARKLTPLALSCIAQGWPALRQLTLENCGRATGEGADVILRTCLALESLKLAHSGRGLPVEFFQQALENMPLLTSLFVDGCDAAEGRFALPKPGPSANCPLQSVRVSRCKKIKSASFQMRGGEMDAYAALERTGVDTLLF